LKKITTIIALFILTITLASCTSEPKTFKLDNYTISRITTIFEERVQYDSKFNSTTESNEVFGLVIAAVAEYDFIFLEDSTDLCETDSPVTILIETNYGTLLYRSSCIVEDDEDKLVTFVEFDDGVIAYASVDLYPELIDIFE
jgi:hypothetical protein